jgi:hypothetical protein
VNKKDKKGGRRGLRWEMKTAVRSAITHIDILCTDYGVTIYHWVALSSLE